MAFEYCIGSEFNTSYEREALQYVINSMVARFDKKESLHLLLANYLIGGHQIDLTVLKKDAIVIIEMKNCEIPFKAYDNKDWIADNGDIIGMKGLNPFLQVKQYRSKWVEMLRENRKGFACLATAQNDQPFWHVRGFVVVTPKLHPNAVNEISGDNWWFKLCGLDSLDESFEFQTNKFMNFSDDELRYIACELLSLEKSRNVDSKKEIDKLKSELRQSSDGLIKFLEESEEHNLQLGKDIERLHDEIQRKNDNIEKLEAIMQQQEKKIQGKGNVQFHFVVKYLLSIGELNQEKVNDLIQLSNQLGINRNKAIEIIKFTIEKSKKT